MKNTLIHMLFGIAAWLLAAGVGHAQAWPTPGRAVQIIVPAPGGSGTGDAIARLLGENLSKRLNVPVVIDNKPGANGNLGAAAAAQAAPDGQKLLFSWAGTLAVNPSLYDNLAFDPPRSFAPIALIGDVPNILVVNEASPARSMAEFIALAKSAKGNLNFGSTGVGSSMHLAGELFMRETGSQLRHIPYNAPGQAVSNLMANEIQAMFQLVPGVVSLVASGRIRALAVMSAERTPALPQVPTTAELGYPHLQASTWFALLAPRGTPVSILERLNTEINEILAEGEVRKKLLSLGVTPAGGSRQALAAQLEGDTRKWSRMVKEIGLKGQ